MLPHCLLYRYKVERRPPMTDYIGSLLSFFRCECWHSFGLPRSEANLFQQRAGKGKHTAGWATTG